MGKNDRNNQIFKKKNSAEAKEKPKFDKKKWRERKYSKKFKLAVEQKKREKDLLRQYYSELKKDPQYAQQIKDKLAQTKDGQTTNREDAGTSTAADYPAETSRSGRKKFNSYEAAQAEMKRIKEEKNRLREEKQKMIEEMKEKLEEYKKKRTERYKILSKKTSKGQPIMKGRLQLLYEQIKKSTSAS